MLADSGLWTLRTLSAACVLLLLLLIGAACWIFVLLARARRKEESVRLERERAEAAGRRQQQIQRLEAIGRLAGGAAHSFNNHLTSILGFSELLLEAGPNANSGRDAIEAIHRAAMRGSEFTQQLFALNRKQSLQLELLNPNTLLKEIEAALRKLAGEKIDLRMTLDGGLGSAMLDRAQTQIVLTNLVSAARDGLPNGGRISIETRNVEFSHPLLRDICELKPGSYVQIAVNDSGAGMDENTRLHIFEPFFLPKQKSRGGGLALALAYSIVRQSNGDISVSSAAGSGTTFTVYFPRLQQQGSAGP